MDAQELLLQCVCKCVMRKQDPALTRVLQVHGLTTAASIWMSAAIGVASGGGMYFDAAFATLTIVLILRFGPRNRPVLEVLHTTRLSCRGSRGSAAQLPAGSLGTVCSGKIWC